MENKNAFKIFFLKKFYINHIYIYIYNTIFSYIKIMQSLFNFYKLSLIEITGCDVTELNNFYFKFHNNLLAIYNFINYKTFFRYIFLINEKNLYSLELLYPNSNWLERELIEFFNYNIINKNDTRNLLLDYNINYHPLLKNFNTEGFEEIYFNYNTYNLEYLNTEFIEL